MDTKNNNTNAKVAMPTTSTSSSIGKNSDVSLPLAGGHEEDEVQSEYKGGPLDSLDALEQVLPYKKSISNFYAGKSKSFTSLSNAESCPSIEDIRKPEDPYTRKRKNLLAFTSVWDKNQGNSKRTAYSRTMFSLGATTNSSESTSGDASFSNSSSPNCCLPPLPPPAKTTLPNEQSSRPS